MLIFLKMQADGPIQNMTSYRNIVYPTQTLISFNKAKTSDLVPKTRIVLPFTVCEILKASSRKWLHFFLTPLLKTSSITALCLRGKEEVISVSLGLPAVTEPIGLRVGQGWARPCSKPPAAVGVL